MKSENVLFFSQKCIENQKDHVRIVGWNKRNYQDICKEGKRKKVVQQAMKLPSKERVFNNVKKKGTPLEH